MGARQGLDPETGERLAERLLTARQLLGRSQAWAAAALGVDWRSYVRYERREVDVPLVVLLRAARVYDRPLEWFLGLDLAVADGSARSAFDRLSEEQQRFVVFEVLPRLGELIERGARLGFSRLDGGDVLAAGRSGSGSPGWILTSWRSPVDFSGGRRAAKERE